MPPIVAASSRLRSIFRSLGKTANLAGGVVRTHWNGLAHGKPPQFAILNHTAIDSGIPRESAPQRLGINPEFRALAVIGMPHFAEITRHTHDGGARGRGCSRGGARLRRERLIRFGSSAYRTPPALATGPV